jgi:ATP-binding cassette subfamily B protein
MESRWKLVRVKFRGFLQRLADVPRAIRLVYDASPVRFGVWAVLLLIQAALPVLAVFLTRVVVDRLAVVLQATSPRDFWPLVGPVAAYAIILAVSEVLLLTSAYVSTVLSSDLQDHINKLVHSKSASVDIAFYEWTEYFDHLHRAQQEATYRPVMLLQSLGALLQNAITLIAMAGILIPYGWWLPALLAISAIPAFWCVIQHSAEQHQWRQASTVRERQSNYLSWLLTDGGTAAELRLFEMGRRFQVLYADIRVALRTGSEKMARRHAAIKLAASGAGLFVSFAGVLWILRKALFGLSTMGDLAFFYHAFREGQRMMYAILHHVGELYYNTLFLRNLFEFLELKPQILSPPSPAPFPTPIRNGFELDRVSFTYPRWNRPVLSEFSLRIPQGRFIALVGPNGAGKSTLVKLLCRLYDPGHGRVLCDEVDYRDLDLVELRRRITVLFQKPAQFNATVHENIAWGRPGPDASREKVMEAARAAGADSFIQQLPQQYDQMLGTWFAQGRELSIGEWQRIALARAFLRSSDLLILDEPTSAMDPWAEYAWMQHFRQISAGQSVLLITHRFTTAMHADEIHVLDQGRIVESGDHRSLIKANGLYCQAWRTQQGGMPDFDPL